MKNVCELMKMFLIPNTLLRRDRQDFHHTAASLSTVPPTMPVASITAFSSSVKCFLGSTLLMLLAFNEDLFPLPVSDHAVACGTCWKCSNPQVKIGSPFWSTYFFYAYLRVCFSGINLGFLRHSCVVILCPRVVTMMR